MNSPTRWHSQSAFPLLCDTNRKLRGGAKAKRKERGSGSRATAKGISMGAAVVGVLSDLDGAKRRNIFHMGGFPLPKRGLFFISGSLR